MVYHRSLTLASWSVSVQGLVYTKICSTSFWSRLTDKMTSFHWRLSMCVLFFSLLNLLATTSSRTAGLAIKQINNIKTSLEDFGTQVGWQIRYFRSYGHVHSSIRGRSMFTECSLARHHHFIDVEITKCVFLLATHIKFFSRASKSSARMANKAFTACSLFTTVIASFCAKRSKRPWNKHHSKNAYCCPGFLSGESRFV